MFHAHAPKLKSIAMTSSMLALALLGGCKNTFTWDLEYSCNGQEQSQALFQGDTAQSIPKTYPSIVDFHLRSDQAMFKSSVNPVHHQTDGAISFGTSTDDFWNRGLFDAKSGALTTIEGRQLKIAGRTQTIHTTGQYVCQVRKSELPT